MERILITDARNEITRYVNAYEYDAVDRVPGIRVFQRMEPVDRHDGYRGAEYVFGTLLGEDWAGMEQGGVPEEFWRDSHTFLRDQGYKRIESEPQEGDIVGYAIEDFYSTYPTSMELVHWAESNRRRPYFEHFGILTSGRRVVSKFSTGHVFVHDLEMVPAGWGTEVHYYRHPTKKVLLEQ